MSGSSFQHEVQDSGIQTEPNILNETIDFRGPKGQTIRICRVEYLREGSSIESELQRYE